MNEMSGKSTYFAFISHKSTDTRFALKLKKFIESYKLPTDIQLEDDILPFKGKNGQLSPLCTYEVNFSCNPLMDEMNEKLRYSRFLILLCSENLVKYGSRYVNYEIETFIRYRREEGIDPISRIIPIIIDGAFDSPEHECCPQALKALGDNRPIAVDRQKCKNNREVFLRAVSGMLDIDYTVMAQLDQRILRRKRIVRSALLTALLAAGICLGEYYIPRSTHYLDYVLQNGVPVGIEKLSKEDYRKTAAHYVFTEQCHRVTELEYVNALGNRIDHENEQNIGDRASRCTFSYSSTGALHSVTYYNKNDYPLYIMQYSSSDLGTVDLKDPNDPNRAYYIGSGYESDPSMLRTAMSNPRHSSISRFEYQYDENGFVRRMTFQADNSGRIASDNSVYGFEYEVDEKGRVIRTYFLDSLWNRRLNSEGIYCKEYTYDDQNNLIRIRNLGRSGDVVADPDGIMITEKNYDDFHNVISVTLQDKDGKPLYVSEMGYARQIMENNEYGQPVKQLWYYEPIEENEPEFLSGLRYGYDENGYINEISLLGDSDTPDLLSSVPGASSVIQQNDERGNPVLLAYADASGNLVENPNGITQTVFTYNDNGLLTRQAYLDSHGNPVNHKKTGASVLETEYDAFGRLLSQRYYDALNNPVIAFLAEGEQRFHRKTITYESGAFTKIIVSYYDTEGNLLNIEDTSSNSAYAQMITFIQNGEITSISYYDKDGYPCGNSLEAYTEYSAQAEKIHTIQTVDSEGNPLLRSVEISNIRGVPIREEITQFSGKNRIAEVTNIYLESGQRKADFGKIYAETGELLMEYSVEYDADERIVFQSLIQFKEPEKYRTEVEQSYDPKGTLRMRITTVSKQDGTVSQIGEEYFSPTGIYSKTVSIEYERNETVTDTILYDENGNRTERRKISCIGDGNYTQTRHTVYYEDCSVETVVGRRRDGTVDEYFEITYDGSGKRIGVRLLEGDPTLES